MSNLVPVHPFFGSDAQGTQRSSVSLNLDYISTDSPYYTRSIPQLIVRDGPNIGIPIATYNNEEYAYFGTGNTDSYSVKYHAYIYAVKTSLTSNTYTGNLLTIDTGYDYNSQLNTAHTFRISLGYSVLGTGYAITNSPDFLYSNTSGCTGPRVYRIDSATNILPFTNSNYYFIDGSSTGFKPLSAFRNNLIYFNGYCYLIDGLGSYNAHLMKFDADNINGDYTSKNLSLGIIDDNEVSSMVFDPTASPSDGNIYVITNYHFYSFNSDDLSLVYQATRSGDTRCRYNAIFKDNDIPYRKRIYRVINTPVSSQDTTPSGIECVDTNFSIQGILTQNDDIIRSAPSLGLDGTIYYRANDKLYAISDDGTVGGNCLSEKHAPYIGLPNNLSNPYNYAAPIIDGLGRIIVCSYYDDGGTTDNVHIFTDTATEFILEKSFYVSGGIATTPSIGSSGLLYILSRSQVLRTYGLALPPTPTTTTTTTSPVTTTTTSTSTGTTTTTSTGTGTTTTTSTTPTTTSTTTTVAPLAVVKTSLFRKVNENFQEVFYTDASDSDETKNQLMAQSFDFGTLASGETSETIAIALNIPYTKAIAEIKLALISTEGLTFTSDTFGVTSYQELRSDIVPETYFEGVNTLESDTYTYNISVPNRNNVSSDYVYLNIKLPSDQPLGHGIIKLKWFFSYAS